MQTVQLLGGSPGRMSFLRCARTHLRADGVLACAILGELDPFDCSDGTVGPEAERTSSDGLLYLSRAIRVLERGERVVIERERRVLPADAPVPSWPFPHDEPKFDGTAERNVIELDRITVATLRGEGSEADLEPQPTRELAATDEHVGSSVVMFRA